MKALKHTLFAIVLLLSGMVTSIHISAAEMTDCTHFGPTMAIAPGNDGDAMRKNGFLSMAPRCVDTAPMTEDCPAATTDGPAYLALAGDTALLKVAPVCANKVKAIPAEQDTDDRVCHAGELHRACASPD